MVWNVNPMKGTFTLLKTVVTLYFYNNVTNFKQYN